MLEEGFLASNDSIEVDFNPPTPISNLSSDDDLNSDEEDLLLSCSPDVQLFAAYNMYDGSILRYNSYSPGLILKTPSLREWQRKPVQLAYCWQVNFTRCIDSGHISMSVITSVCHSSICLVAIAGAYTLVYWSGSLAKKRLEML